MDALLVVHMQVGLLTGKPKHDLRGVLDRINRLAVKIRAESGKVILVQHCGGRGDDFEPQAPGWEFLPELVRKPQDIVLPTTLNDPFVATDLETQLTEIRPSRVLVTGWATDFCVDSTVRSLVAHQYDVVAVADGHTLSDRPHLDASSVIRHHNWVWSNLITPRSIRVASTEELLTE
jgi:nicotinamidase-related amidase